MSAGKQMRFTDTELSMIKGAFKGNEKLVMLLRKIFLPELRNDAPLGQNIDLWMTLKVDDMSPEQAIINLKARNSLIGHVEQQLMQISVLANLEEETPAEKEVRLEKDSTK